MTTREEAALRIGTALLRDWGWPHTDDDVRQWADAAAQLTDALIERLENTCQRCGKAGSSRPGLMHSYCDECLELIRPGAIA